MSTGKYDMPYTYKVDNLITGEFYYGSRYVNTVAPDMDLWVVYFTSSKSVNSLINKYGKESFRLCILNEYNNSEECFRREQELIKENISNPLCLNKQYVKETHPIFLHNSHTDESKIKIGAASKGRIPWNKGKEAHNKGKAMSTEQKEKLSAAHTGKILSAETRAKMREAALQRASKKSKKE